MSEERLARAATSKCGSSFRATDRDLGRRDRCRRSARRAAKEEVNVKTQLCKTPLTEIEISSARRTPSSVSRANAPSMPQNCE